VSGRVQAIVIADVILSRERETLSAEDRASLEALLTETFESALATANSGEWQISESYDVRVLVKPYPPPTPVRP
jgi:hypothetical protein